MSKSLASSNIEKTIRDYLVEQDFEVKRHRLIDRSFDVDLLATRGGLTVVIDIVLQSYLGFDSVAKLETVSSYLQSKFKTISIKKMLITTSEEIPTDIEEFARDNRILLLKVLPKIGEIRSSLDQIDFLKPITRTKIDVLEILENKLKGIGDKDRLSLLNKIRTWYQEGGKSLVTRRMKKEIDKVARGDHKV